MINYLYSKIESPAKWVFFAKKTSGHKESAGLYICLLKLCEKLCLYAFVTKPRFSIIPTGLRIFALVLFLLISVFRPAELQAQMIKGYVAGGFNLSQVDGDEAYGYNRFGGNIGVAAMIPLGKNFDVSLETSFTQKGAFQKPQYKSDSLNGAYELRLNYVEVPVLIHYTDKDFITIGTGFSWGRLVGASEFEHGYQTATTAANGVYSPDDFSVLVDLRMRMADRLKFNFRYQYSVAKIRTREFTNLANQTWIRDQYNNLLTIRLIYMFNEPQGNQRINRKEK
jgi:hypothetical protein